MVIADDLKCLDTIVCFCYQNAMPLKKCMRNSTIQGIVFHHQYTHSADVILLRVVLLMGYGDYFYGFFERNGEQNACPMMLFAVNENGTTHHFNE